MPDVAPRDFVSIQEITRAERVSIPQMVGGRGPRGLSIELRTTATDIEWRIAGASPEADWAVLTPLEAITGPQGDAGDEVALRATETAIEWRLGEDGEWETLVVLEDLRGPRGFTGDAATLEVGTVVDSAPGSAPAVENVGDEHHAILNFTLPRGADGIDGEDGVDGNDGAAATLEVGATTTLAAGESATVTNEGDETHAVLRFAIPQGGKGDPGNDGLGWTGATYDPATGVVTFVSNDGLGFTTGDLRGQDGQDGQDGADGIGVPDASGEADGRILTVENGEWVAGDAPDAADGTGVDSDSPRGEWSSADVYNRDDTVSLDGAVYVATTDGLLGSAQGPLQPNSPELVDGGSLYAGGVYGQSYLASGASLQYFKVSRDCVITGVRVRNDYNNGGTATVRLLANPSPSVSWNAMAGTQLATAVGAVQNDLYIEFDTPVSLLAGTQYALAVSGGYLDVSTTQPADNGVLTDLRGRRYASGLSSSFGNEVSEWGRIQIQVEEEWTPLWRLLSPAELPDTAAASEGDVLTLGAGKVPGWDAPGGGGADPTPDIFMMMGA